MMYSCIGFLQNNDILMASSSLWW